MQSKIRFASQGETTMADFFDDQNNMTEDDDIITLYNEVADKDEDFYHLATLDVDDKWFVVLKPVEKLDRYRRGRSPYLRNCRERGRQRRVQSNRGRRSFAKSFRRIYGRSGKDGRRMRLRRRRLPRRQLLLLPSLSSQLANIHRGICSATLMYKRTHVVERMSFFCSSTRTGQRVILN